MMNNFKFLISNFTQRVSLIPSFGIIQTKVFGNSSSRAFGIIEVLISGVLVITVIGATVSVRQTANNQASASLHEQTALMLAQEGIEAVRQIRDTNYLAQQKPNRTTNLSKRIWNCDLNALMMVAQESTGGFFATCNGTVPESAYPTNHGNFAAYTFGNSRKQTLELGKGMQGGAIFRDDVLKTAMLLPAWHVSSPNRADIGTNANIVGGAPRDYSAYLNMDADNCRGVERIFMKEGSIPSVSAEQVLANRRKPAVQTNDTQDNKITAPAGIIGDCLNLPPAGYFEYKRQLIIDAGGPNRLVGGVYANDEAPGNLPSSWLSSNNNVVAHEVRVLVRVSWEENNRSTGLPNEQGVLLATYLTDWRPSN